MENEIIGWLAFYAGVGLGLSGSAWGLSVSPCCAIVLRIFVPSGRMISDSWSSSKHESTHFLVERLC